MTGATQTQVFAAGAVCWSEHDSVVRVLLIHRDHHKDVSFPKGKVDPGESVQTAAVREVDEETGYRVALGIPLGTTEYVLPSGRDKIVHYWAAEITPDELERAGEFTPNDEVASLDWVTIDQARTRLTYERDVTILEQFARHVSAGTHRTFALIALRHAKATPGADWDGPDATRPLLRIGRAQAKAIAPTIAAYGPRKIVSSTAARCLATVEPLSTRTRRGVSSTDDISQDAYERGKADIKRVVRKRLARGQTAVICTHGPVLPEVIARVARSTATAPDQFDLRKASALPVGGFAIMHISSETLVDIETFDSGIAG